MKLHWKLFLQIENDAEDRYEIPQQDARPLVHELSLLDPGTEATRRMDVHSPGAYERPSGD